MIKLRACPHTGFPMNFHLSRLRLFQRHLPSLVRVWVWAWDSHFSSPTFPHSKFSSPASTSA